MKGLPSEFRAPLFYALADMARDKCFAVKADDERALQALMAESLVAKL
jgi:hypothetical protein